MTLVCLKIGQLPPNLTVSKIFTISMAVWWHFIHLTNRICQRQPFGLSQWVGFFAVGCEVPYLAEFRRNLLASDDWLDETRWDQTREKLGSSKVKGFSPHSESININWGWVKAYDILCFSDVLGWTMMNIHLQVPAILMWTEGYQGLDL